jgi:CRP/FNR family transcriptional regulator, cyclic AMP receptor protein
MLDHIESVIGNSVKRNLASGSIILYQGEAPRSACVLLEGVVKVYSISSDGDEQIVMFVVPGDIFPLSWLFNKTSAVMFFYEALTDCKVALVQPDILKDALLSTPESMEDLIEYFVRNYTATQVRVNALQQSKARDKLVYMLYYLCRRYGELDDKKELTLIPIDLTHQNFASLVGLTRETTAIEMNRLKKQKIITYKKQRYCVDLQKLMEIIGEDSFKNIKV